MNSSWLLMIQVQGNKEAIQINIGKELKTNAPYSFSEKTTEWAVVVYTIDGMIFWVKFFSFFSLFGLEATNSAAQGTIWDARYGTQISHR